jgi:hypothetical protein
VTGRWRRGRASAGAVVDAEADVSIDLGTGTVTFGEARRDITRSAGLDDQRKRGMSSARTEPRYRIEADGEAVRLVGAPLPAGVSESAHVSGSALGFSLAPACHCAERVGSLGALRS